MELNLIILTYKSTKIMKKVILLLIFTPFLVATQCKRDYIDIISKNNYIIKITDKSNYHINDTVWIEGFVSSKVYNSAIGDSIFYDNIYGLSISLYKFITPTSNINANDALDKFELIYPIELLDFTGFCPNSTLTVKPILDSSRNFYTLKFGLKINQIGDYIIKFNYNQKIENSERNLNIINDYKLLNSPFILGLSSCNMISYTENTDIGDFCFNVN